jgi:hypothetical protein
MFRRWASSFLAGFRAAPAEYRGVHSNRGRLRIHLSPPAQGRRPPKGATHEQEPRVRPRPRNADAKGKGKGK